MDKNGFVDTFHQASDQTGPKEIAHNLREMLADESQKLSPYARRLIEQAVRALDGKTEVD